MTTPQDRTVCGHPLFHCACSEDCACRQSGGSCATIHPIQDVVMVAKFPPYGSSIPCAPGLAHDWGQPLAGWVQCHNCDAKQRKPESWGSQLERQREKANVLQAALDEQTAISLERLGRADHAEEELIAAREDLRAIENHLEMIAATVRWDAESGVSLVTCVVRMVQQRSRTRFDLILEAICVLSVAALALVSLCWLVGISF